MYYGYLRVSTKEQNEARQLDAMLEKGIPKKNLFLDKMSGKDFERPNYKKMLSKLKKGDVLYIQSLDRLGRNYQEILKQWDFLINIKQIDIVVLDMPILSTQATAQDLTGVFLGNLILQILSYVAEIERENIKTRQAEGIASAKARGIHFGKQKIPIPPKFNSVYQDYINGKYDAYTAGQILGISRATFYRWIHDSKKSTFRTKN